MMYIQKLFLLPRVNNVCTTHNTPWCSRLSSSTVWVLYYYYGLEFSPVLPLSMRLPLLVYVFPHGTANSAAEALHLCKKKKKKKGYVLYAVTDLYTKRVWKKKRLNVCILIEREVQRCTLWKVQWGKIQSSHTDVEQSVHATVSLVCCLVATLKKKNNNNNNNNFKLMLLFCCFSDCSWTPFGYLLVAFPFSQDFTAGHDGHQRRQCFVFCFVFYQKGCLFYFIFFIWNWSKRGFQFLKRCKSLTIRNQTFGKKKIKTICYLIKE